MYVVLLKTMETKVVSMKECRVLKQQDKLVSYRKVS